MCPPGREELSTQQRAESRSEEWRSLVTGVGNGEVFCWDKDPASEIRDMRDVQGKPASSQL